MGKMCVMRDRVEAKAKEAYDNIKGLMESCSTWRNDLCDVYNNDTDWYNSASEWLLKEVSVTIDWLDHLMDWADHYVTTLGKMYELICDEYDSYTEAELNSTIKIYEYLAKSERRADIALEWYDIASTLYENFQKVLSGKYTAETVDRIVRSDNQLFNQLAEVADAYDDNSDNYWIKK